MSKLHIQLENQDLMTIKDAALSKWKEGKQPLESIGTQNFTASCWVSSVLDHLQRKGLEIEVTTKGN